MFGMKQEKSMDEQETKGQERRRREKVDKQQDWTGQTRDWQRRCWAYSNDKDAEQRKAVNEGSEKGAEATNGEQ